MESRPRYYLDHAATSWPKPPGSLEACIDFQINNGASAGRGIYHSAEASSRLVQSARQAVARLIHAPSERHIAFCNNGTHALNAAILGFLHSPTLRGCHVVTTATEHNSVLRPLELAHKTNGTNWTAVQCDETGFVDPNRIIEAMTPDTRLIVVNHASNVTGSIQDVRTLAGIAKSKNAILLVDAAQSLGYLPINVLDCGIQVLAAPGHKGAGGMLGTGILYVHEEVQHLIEPIWIGGTGSQSDSISGPFDWLSAVESGNSNLPGIASLKAGIEWLETRPLTAQTDRWAQQLIEAILEEPSLKLIGPLENRLPVISLIHEYSSCHEMAMILDSACQVEARSGFHCAALIHPFLGTQSTGGTLRLSLGHTTVEADVEAAIEGIHLLGSLHR
ncbi:MAG: aminotransferase class V-fold PLP-dependent enzyme [Planctomycetota bacterium]|nr:aminotransferase class V-fold PLP-dependent enzyme [Planctomycetota bacterium]